MEAQGEMMRLIEKFRAWLYKRYLPRVTMDTYIQEREKLHEAIKAQQARIKELEAYIDGVQDTLRRTNIRITNYNGANDDR